MFQRKNSSKFSSVSRNKSWSARTTSTFSKSGNFNSNGENNSKTGSASSSKTKRSFDEDADDQENNDFDSIDSQNFVCLSIFHHGGKLGASYFEGATKFLYVLEDVEESCDTFPMFQNLLRQIRPNTVLASLKQDHRLMFHLKRNCLQCRETNSEASSSVEPVSIETDDKAKLSFIPAKSFDLESCRRTISDALTKDNVQDLGEDEKRLQASFAINFEATCMTRSLGVLIKYLNLTRFVNPEKDSRVVNISDNIVLGVKNFSIQKMVIVDPTSLTALQVFQKKFHPSVYKVGQGGTKEGLSLFSLCNRCCSTPGAIELKRWFLRPSSNKETLDKRLDAVQFFASDNNVDLASAMRKSLRSIGYLNRILIRMQQLQADVGNWFTLYKTVYNCVHLGELLKIREKKPQLLDDLSKYFNVNLVHIGNLLGKIADFDEMRSQNRFVVKDGIDAELDKQKQLYANLPDIMTEFVTQEMENLSFTPTECSMTYMPIIGYLLVIPKDDNDEMNNYEKPGLEFLFCADNMCHYKSPCCRRLDVEFGDVKFHIVDCETSIMIRFQKVILEYACTLVDAVGACAQLDCLISLALASREFNWVKPTISENETIEIEKGRHPLVELCTTPFVPNSTLSNVSSGAKVHVITGPNAAGKSIYLKQVGVIVYLAHIGCFVPAERATIGVVDRIFTRVHTIDSVLDGMSTFATDVKQVAVAVAEATKHSLVIIDEFGKGALTEVGLSLLTSSVESWLKKEIDCPHLFVSTHLHAMIAMLPKSNLIRFETMETARKGTDFVFLYELVEGFIECSFAIHVANQVGLVESIIGRSYEICSILKAGDRLMRPNETEDSYLSNLASMQSLIDGIFNQNLDECDPSVIMDRFRKSPQCSNME